MGSRAQTVAVALACAACATFTDPIPGVRYPSSPARVLLNNCDRGRLPDAVAVVVAVTDTARELELLRHWPTDPPFVLCVVTDRPYVTCAGAGRPLAGCTRADGLEVLVAEKWAPRGDWRLEPHDWRATLIHEVIAAGAVTGWLGLPAPTPETESQWVKGSAYRALADGARGRLGKQ